MFDSASAGAVAFLGRLGDVHALREPLADARVGGGHRAIRRAEALTSGTARRGNRLPRCSSVDGVIQVRPPAQPATFGGSNSDCPRRAVMRPKSGIVGTSRSPASCRSRPPVHRALDLRRVRRRAVEVLREEDRFSSGLIW
jgi:hypothetical protein